MNWDSIDLYFVFVLFILLLFDMGLKIAVIPFIDSTRNMDGFIQRKVALCMVHTGVTNAVSLGVLGWFLLRLLHFNAGAVNIAGGVVLLLAALAVQLMRDGLHDLGIITILGGH